MKTFAKIDPKRLKIGQGFATLGPPPLWVFLTAFLRGFGASLVKKHRKP